MSRLHEFKELFNQITLAWERGEQAVLVILADVKGSAYRLPGTKMLMISDGQMFGTISGGCLENDLYEIAQKVFETKTVVGAKAATYFATGYSGDTKCASCGLFLAKGTTLAKLKLAKPKFSTKAGKKSFKVTYNKVAGAVGFEVRYRIKGKWTVKSYPAKKKVTKTIKKLKKGTYKVQVRAYVLSGKTKAYSAWASVRKVKVK